MSVAFRKRRRSPEERRAMELDALSRARSNPSMSNFADVIRAFMDRGIPMAEINPKENCFTYHAWRALGRQVRKGEHGVKVSVCFRRDKAAENEGDKPESRTIFASAVVFHVSQTDAIAELVNA